MLSLSTHKTSSVEAAKLRESVLCARFLPQRGNLTDLSPFKRSTFEEMSRNHGARRSNMEEKKRVSQRSMNGRMNKENSM